MKNIAYNVKYNLLPILAWIILFIGSILLIITGFFVKAEAKTKIEALPPPVRIETEIVNTFDISYYIYANYVHRIVVPCITIRDENNQEKSFKVASDSLTFGMKFWTNLRIGDKVCIEKQPDINGEYKYYYITADKSYHLLEVKYEI